MNEANLWDLSNAAPATVVGAALSIGNFDGVHLGHHRLIAMLRHLAKKIGARGVAVSFEPHPLTLLRPESAPIPLTTPARRSQLLQMAGVDEVLLLKTSHQLLGMSADDFFHNILVDKLQVKGIVEGGNFAFGKGRSGNVDTLRRLCVEAGIQFESAYILESDKAAISSTSIRESLRIGDVSRAAELLGRPHRVTGKVVEGDKRGRTIGVPTANLSEIIVAVPLDGVYSARVEYAGKVYAAACNVGPIPSFGIAQRRFEVHIIDFEGDLYGKSIDVDLLTRIRETRSFSSLEQLKSQIAEDIAAATAILQSSTQSASESARELSRTIAEWLRWRVEPSLMESNGRLAATNLRDSGLLEIQWKLADRAAPHDVHQLLFHLEREIMQTFPEVKDVAQESV